MERSTWLAKQSGRNACRKIGAHYAPHGKLKTKAQRSIKTNTHVAPYKDWRPRLPPIIRERLHDLLCVDQVVIIENIVGEQTKLDRLHILFLGAISRIFILSGA